MATSSITAMIDCDIRRVWEVLLAVDSYGLWRSDLKEAKFLSGSQFAEYTKEGYSTIFTITAVEPYKRWEFDMENSNMAGHWVGIFTPKGSQTEVCFTEHITVKKQLMKPFAKLYLKKQQKQFVRDLEQFLAR